MNVVEYFEREGKKSKEYISCIERSIASEKLL